MLSRIMMLACVMVLAALWCYLLAHYMVLAHIKVLDNVMVFPVFPYYYGGTLFFDVGPHFHVSCRPVL